MEPYRSAFVAKCLQDQLIQVEPIEQTELMMSQNPGMRLCGTPELIGETLQLAVLASGLSMVWADAGSAVKERGLAHMKLSGLDKIGVIHLIGEYPAEIASQEESRWVGYQGLGDLWKLEQEEIDALSPIILTQLEARGKAMHRSLFELLRARRLKEDRAIPFILSTVPDHLRKQADIILKLEPHLDYLYDFPIFMTLQELRLTTATAVKEGARIAGAAPCSVDDEEAKMMGREASQLWGLVVEELIDEKIVFPIPSEIRDVIEMRNRSEISDFRSFLIPFIESLLAGDENTAISLRRDLKSCVKAFRRFPVTKRLGKWTGYASLGVGAVEAATGLLGLSMGTGVVAFGLEALAKKWKSKSSWLWLANTGSN